MNRQDSGRFGTESLESAAKRYKTLGFSIFPVQGARNPQQPKLPAIKWARFQHTYPSHEELQTWFHAQPDAGIAIVCGRISRLMVLDFDDASVASEFRRLHSDMVDTFTVRSGARGLPHFYYRLPKDKLITTSAYPGADLRGEGAYVVAPPTRIGQVEWVVENDVPIHEISDFELRRVMRFLAGLKATDVQPLPVITETQIPKVSEFRHLPSGDELIAHYRQLCGSGRNQALFKTAVMARDADITETSCCFILAAIHGQEPGVEKENYRTRYEEAVRTIASAYKRPARQSAKSSVSGLGNAAREWLLTNAMTSLARVLDGLYAVGMNPDSRFTEFEACQKLMSLKIGRRSIMAALKSTIADCVVFEVDKAPLYPPTQANAAVGSDDLNNSCEMSRGAKRIKIVKRGRPAKQYRLPSPMQVAEMIGIKTTASDVVPSEDFVSSRSYRMALHRQLLERRPGHYARAWLGNRLGVSRWTTRRYEKAAKLYVQPAYATQGLTWSSAAKLPLSVADAPHGVFLEVADGKRYPAVRGLALKLLKQGCELVLKQQQANYYAGMAAGVGIPTPLDVAHVEGSSAMPSRSQRASTAGDGLSVGIPTPSNYRIHQQPEVIPKVNPVGIPTPPIPTQHYAAASSVGIPTPQEHEPTFWLCPDCLDFHVMADRPGACTRCGCNCDWEVIPTRIWRDAQALKQWWQQRYRDHQQTKRVDALSPIKQPDPVMTAQAKALAEKIHAEIPNFSWANARRVVSEFGEQLIEKALLVVKSRKGLRSPAGFMMSFLKSEHKLILNNNKSDNSQPTKPKGESAVEWVRRLAKSQYLSFIANADDILNFGLSHEPSPA